jgi:hypothetical protein
LRCTCLRDVSQPWAGKMAHARSACCGVTGRARRPPRHGLDRVTLDREDRRVATNQIIDGCPRESVTRRPGT